MVLALLGWGIVSVLTRTAESEGAGVEGQGESGGAARSAPASGDVDSRYAPSSVGSDGSVDGSGGAMGPVKIPTCEPGDLGVTVSVKGAPVSVGAGATFDVGLENTSNIQCATAWGQVSVKVVSGDQTVYDSTTCAKRDTTATPLLLSPAATWKGTLEWSGDVYDGCTAVDGDGDGKANVAGAGTYRVQVLLNGKNLGGEQVFEVR